MKTGHSRTNIEFSPIPPVDTGQVPYLFRQKGQTALTGETLRPGGLALTRRAVDFCGFEAGDFILDAGCGYGMTLRDLNKTYRFHALGTDVSPNILNRPCPGLGKNRFVRSKLPELPFQRRVFNGIFCECVVSLVSDKPACLKEFLRVLKPGGKLVITDLYIPRTMAARAGAKDGRGFPGSCLDGALPLLELLRIVEAAGFKIDIIEDHTSYLEHLAGQILSGRGKRNDTWHRLGKKLCGNAWEAVCRTGRLKPGYGLIIAYKAF